MAASGKASIAKSIMRYLKDAVKSTLIITGATTILLIVTLVVGEYWARKTAPNGPVVGVGEINALNQTFAYHPWAGFRNTPGFEYPEGNQKVVKINKYGWRGPEPALDRPKNVKRAILLGDSVPFSGWGCREGVTLGGALTRALELRSGEEWEVINTATGAGFSSMSLAALAHEGMRFRPDVVVSFNGGNDLLILEPGLQYIAVDRPGDMFKSVIYHAIQEKIQKIYDPRISRYDQSIILDQLVGYSELLRRARQFLDSWTLGRASALKGVPAQHVTPFSSRAGFDRLDYYIDNELAMSYLATGSGVPFIAFLQPYLSLKHKVIGEVDKSVIKEINAGAPELLPWLDDVYPILRSKLEAAAALHPSLRFVDLSLMFTTEQVFADNAHIRCEDWGLSMPGNELIAARMADAIVAAVYQDKALPDWRKTHIDGAPHDWNDQAYLDANPDVAKLIVDGKFANGYAHYFQLGFLEGRHSGFPTWNEEGYLSNHPDVARLVADGTFTSGFDHYLSVGRAEGRLHGLRPRWVEESYLHANKDVAQAVQLGHFKSGLDHYRKAGAKEGRNGGFSGWDEEGYLLAHKDVKNEVDRGTFTSGLDHYYRAGVTIGNPLRLGTYIPPQ